MRISIYFIIVPVLSRSFRVFQPSTTAGNEIVGLKTDGTNLQKQMMLQQYVWVVYKTFLRNYSPTIMVREPSVKFKFELSGETNRQRNETERTVYFDQLTWLLQQHKSVVKCQTLAITVSVQRFRCFSCCKLHQKIRQRTFDTNSFCEFVVPLLINVLEIPLFTVHSYKPIFTLFAFISVVNGNR